MIDFGLKVHHKIFFIPRSKRGRAMGPQSGFIFGKNAVFYHFHLPKSDAESRSQSRKSAIRVSASCCTTSSSIQYHLQPPTRVVKKLQIVKIEAQKKGFSSQYWVQNTPIEIAQKFCVARQHFTNFKEHSHESVPLRNTCVEIGVAYRIRTVPTKCWYNDFFKVIRLAVTVDSAE